ncbi:MAG: M20/M25/M40 family metallo-hydrolase [Pseudothermotoga sp.]|uniref:M20/M25/M40 family metallo-hydrolase n=1 Tax=Pseudothermotoga sp. TaxID=2033661 RepID=UPI000B05CFA4|nr:M20/M25/M40 family metallo-hydrolase [Pseudothermotoga sp.]HBT38901.1 peptidase M42 [Pseudothermotoga sp.]HCO97816.1 peptidase M42 [Pseudothermotoga sp.]
MNTKELLMQLSNLDGPSGFETIVLDAIEPMLAKVCDRTWRNRVGTLVGEVKGSGRKRVGIFAHVDEIGLVVAKVEEGNFLRLETVGGVDPKVLLAQRLKVYTRRGTVSGIVGTLPPHLQKEEHRVRFPDYDRIFVDVSCDSAASDVRVGDICVFDVKAAEISGKICGKALDNRAGCASLLLAAESLQKLRHESDVYFIFSSQEEIGGPGAGSIAYELELDEAIVVDVTHANVKQSAFPTIRLGEGPVLSVGPAIDSEFYKRAVETAQRNGVKTQIEPIPGRSGTDTDQVQITRIGVKTLLVSIPLMYMHTPIEVVDPKDVEETARLLALIVAE